VSDEQQVAARDTTFDGVIPERLWISTRTTQDRKYILVIAEINGIEKEIDRIYVGNYDGILSSSTQLTWVILQATDALSARLAVAQAKLEAAEKHKLYYMKESEEWSAANTEARAKLAEVEKERDEYKFMYAGLCK
jgi:hypothetical protein